jgi:dephospho-CoA kinase
MLHIGLTGGIGSGKTAVSDGFAALGVPVVDSDVVAHQLTGPDGAAMPALRAAFGDTIARPDGALDRDAMRARVFADPTEKARLEAILHPLIRARCDAQLDAAQATGAPYAILVIPLLAETTGRRRCDRVIVVDCPEALQRTRVMRRNGLPADQVDRIMAAQASRSERLAIADDVIENSGDLAALHAAVGQLDRRYRALATPGSNPA